MMGGVNVQRRPPRKKKPRELRDRGQPNRALGEPGRGPWELGDGGEAPSM